MVAFGVITKIPTVINLVNSACNCVLSYALLLRNIEYCLGIL